MAKERSQKVVETYKAVAAGVASVVTALFTSRLGIAGTLIGTALTAVSITLISAILKVQLEKASDTIAGLPGAVQGRLSTQQIRIPGSPSPEPNPEPAQPESRREKLRGRLRGLFARLRALPGFLKDLPSNQRRKMLLAGVFAGLLATAIGLTGVTGIEIAGGKTLSCLVWSSCPEDDSSEDESSGSSGGLSIFGGTTRTSTAPQAPQGAPGGVPPSGDPSGQQPVAPGDGQQVPQQRQPAGQPAQPSDGGGAAPRQPGTPSDEEAPEDGALEQPDPKDAGQPEPGQKDDSKSRPEGSLGPRGAEESGPGAGEEA